MYSLDFDDFNDNCSLTVASKTGFLDNSGLFASLAVGQRAYVMARCPSCIRLNIFSETTN